VSTHDLPLAETFSVAERELFHNGTRSVGLDTCVEERQERKRVLRRKREEILANREFELKSLEIEREILELNIKMKEFAETKGVAREVHSQGVRWSDQEVYRASSSDREDGVRD